ncbi:hypothetical protein GCM10007092_16540 [Thermus composti]|uniref:Cyclase family protein n=1 Tax=Thermus composti TaxID=532059 RepID=A0ABV6Q0L8_9DEIN|nr:hypothetical protein [Thermus composti]GGN02848.1 hypothetical protein GCM10007092_16540 [Thermus composti]
MCAPWVMESVAQSVSRRALLGAGLGLLAGRALAQAEVPGKAFSKVVNLPHVLSPEIPLFPGAEPMRITTLVTVRQNGYYGNFPGFSPEAAEFLVREREIVGVDTLSLDFGPSKDFRAHVALLGAGKYGLENLANLAQVPPFGALIFVGGAKHKEASGGPVRAVAIR